MKYGLDPLINDTDMALFMIVDDLLEGYSDTQRAIVTKLKSTVGGKDSATGFFRRKSEINALALPPTMQRLSKHNEVEEHGSYSKSLNLSSMF